MRLFTFSRPLFRGETSIDQLVEVIAVLGPPNREDLEGMGVSLDDCPFVQKVASPIALPTFDARLRVKMGAQVPKPIDLVLKRIFKYIPEERLSPKDAVTLTEQFEDCMIDQ